MEEIEEQVPDPDSRENYREPICFVTVTHTDKSEGKTDKRRAGFEYRKDDSASCATRYFTFDELVKAHSDGMTFRRLPAETGNWKTRFLMVDIDNKFNADVTEDELKSILDGYTYGITGSGNGEPYHYHVFILLDTPVFSGAEFIAARDCFEGILNSGVRRLRGMNKELPRLTDPQCTAFTDVFGPAVPERREIGGPGLYESPVGWILSDTPVKHMLRTHDFPGIRLYKELASIPMEDKAMPLTVAGFIRYLERGGAIGKQRLDDLEFCFRPVNLWYMRPGKDKGSEKVREGSRDRTLYAFTLNLYDIWRAWNLWIGDHGLDSLRFGEDFLVSSLMFYIRGSVEDGIGESAIDLEHFRNLMRKRIGANSKVTDREWCEERRKYSMKARAWKTLDYSKETATSVMLEHLDESGKVRFASRESLEGILRDRGISLSTFRRRVRESGRRLSYGNPGNPGKTRVSIEGILERCSGKLTGSVVVYSGKLTGSDRKWLVRHGYSTRKTR